MANPKVKDGYFPIANELAEQFARVNIPGNEMRIVWVVLRKTWGWKNGSRRKDWDWISISQFEKYTDIKHANCVRSLKSLVVKRILLKKENQLKFNQNYNEWVVAKRIPPVVKRILGSSQKDTRFGSQKDTYKRKLTKETNTKETQGEQSSQVNSIFKLFEDSVNPTINYGHRTNRAICEELIKKFGYEKTVQTVKYAISVQSKRYAPTITTPYQLKEKLGQLMVYYKKQNKPKIAIIS